MTTTLWYFCFLDPAGWVRYDPLHVQLRRIRVVLNLGVTISLFARGAIVEEDKNSIILGFDVFIP